MSLMKQKTGKVIDFENTCYHNFDQNVVVIDDSKNNYMNQASSIFLFYSRQQRIPKIILTPLYLKKIIQKPISITKPPEIHLKRPISTKKAQISKIVHQIHRRNVTVTKELQF